MKNHRLVLAYETETSFFSILGAGRLRPWCGQVWCILRPLCLACGQLSCHCPHMVLRVCVCVCACVRACVCVCARARIPMSVFHKDTSQSGLALHPKGLLLTQSLLYRPYLQTNSHSEVNGDWDFNIWILEEHSVPMPPPLLGSSLSLGPGYLPSVNNSLKSCSYFKTLASLPSPYLPQVPSGCFP